MRSNTYLPWAFSEHFIELEVVLEVIATSKWQKSLPNLGFFSPAAYTEV